VGPIPHDTRTDTLLVLPMQVLAWAFFILPIIRLFIFRLTGFALPPSVHVAAITLVALLYLLVSHRKFTVPLSAPIGFSLLFLPLTTYLAVGGVSNTIGAILATTWIYFLAPCCAILIGTISADRAVGCASGRPSQTVDRWLTVSTVCVISGIIVNAVDLALLGDSYFEVYKSFRTTAAATFAGFSLPRLAGAYFSGLDLTFAIVMLLLIQASRGRRVAWVTRFILYVSVLFTFTRNAYVILALWILISRLSNNSISRFGAIAYLLSPLLSLGVMTLLAFQSASGQLEMNAETSSVLTRLSSWVTISDAVLSNPTAGLFGLGLTQNALVPGESDIYAIDSFFWELVCYAGAVAFIAYGVLFREVRIQALRKSSAVSRIALALTALIPVAGTFNNMVGSMFSFVLFICYGLLGRFALANQGATGQAPDLEVPRGGLAYDSPLR